MVIACLSYSTAVWTERAIKQLKIWMIVLFALGFLCDTIGTSMMFMVSTTKFHLTIHSGIGYAALAIMALHLTWAILSIRKIGRYEEYFTRFSIVAWILWMAAFISGIIINM